MSLRRCVVMMVLVVVVTSDEARHNCDEVAQRLMNIAVAPTSGPHPEPNSEGVCGVSECCTADWDAALQQHGQQHVQHAIKRAAARVRAAILTKAAALNGVMSEALEASEAETLKVFHSSYPRLVSSVQPILHNLFRGFKEALEASDSSSLDKVLTKFWNELFPSVYHSAVHAKMPPFTEEYSKCIRESTKIIKPWGILPALVDDPVTRLVESARLLLHALHTAAQAARTPETFVLPEECVAAAARVHPCGLCHAVTAPPCHNLCLNVARGCLAPLAEIGAGWSDLVNGVARAGKALRAAHPVLLRLPDHLPDAVLVAMETGPKLQKKVRRQCGPPTHELPSIEAGAAKYSEASHRTDANSKHSSSVSKQDSGSMAQEGARNGGLANEDGVASASDHIWNGDSLIKQIIKDMYASREWFQELPNAVCHNTSRLVQDEPCWNGHQLAPYSHELAGVGVGAQKYNPEVRLERPDSSVYAVADTLRALKREILGRITWLPMSDSQMRTHTGAPPPERRYPDGGSGSYYDQDDEDSDYGGSGYGSGDGPVDVEEYSRTSGSPNIHQPVSGGEIAGSSVLESSKAVTALTCLLWMAASVFWKPQ